LLATQAILLPTSREPALLDVSTGLNSGDCTGVYAIYATSFDCPREGLRVIRRRNRPFGWGFHECLGEERLPDAVGVEFTADPITGEDVVQERYGERPSLREMQESGQIDRDAYERAKRLRVEGPPARPFYDLIAKLRAERERQGLSLTEIAERTGMDRAAIHKLEIGLNKNPTCATLARFADALGARIAWNLDLRDQGKAATAKI